MLTREYEMPWRPAYEGYAVVAWLAAAVASGYAAVGVGTHVGMGLAVGAICVMMTLVRGSQALKVLKIRASLGGRAMEMIDHKKLRELCRNPNQVFLGLGFEWEPKHSQRLYELAKVNFKDFAAPHWLLRLTGTKSCPQPDSEMGLPYIHGVEPTEQPLYRPLVNFEGGTCIAGTTQSGKGVALSSLICQAAYRGDVVIIFDPKNSKRLKNNVKKACREARAPDTFLDFHPAFPEEGVRLDPMFNWQKPTELASRIQSIMPPDTSGSFTAFGWDAVNVVVQGLVDLEDRPNLMKLTQYIEAGLEPVLEKLLRRFFDERLGAKWRDMDEFRKLLQDAKKGGLGRPPSEATTPELLAYVTYYETQVAAHERTKVLDSQVRTFRHNREHYQKITANLLPILSMLTSGDLGRSLSPDPFDVNDPRPIMNLEKIVNGGHVLYVSLDSLPDPAVASAIGAIFLADLAAYAGIRYNLGGNRRISLFVDEVSNVINQPLIEILNKGAEGGIYTTCAMQTLADLASRLGSEEKARMALGNLNNLIALRSKDRPTQDFIVETFGKTMIHQMRVGLNTGADSYPGDFTVGYSTQLTETLEESVPAEILGKLPNLEYFASVAGGRLRKGRFQILDPSDADDDRKRAAA
jgi:conjugal transfer pilus assembly protein TraD